MKKYLPYGVALAIVGLAATPLISQTQTTSSSSSSGYIQTSKIIGTKVKTQSGEEVGVVKDVVVDRSSGCMAYTVLSAGGGGSRVTGQSKLVAVPWSVYSVSPDASYLTTTIERDRIYNGPVFEYSRISDPSFTSTVYSSFGVSAGVGYSNATSTTTGVNTQTQTNAQTNATNNPNNPPPPAAGPTNNPSPGVGASPSASASATAEPSASASASPSKATRGTKSGMSPVSSPRQRGDEMKGTSTNGESASESTGSTSSSGTKGSKSSKKGSSAETSSDTESSGEATEKPSSSKHSSHKKGTSSGEGTTTTEPSPGEQE